jgi:hypothetical protein
MEEVPPLQWDDRYVFRWYGQEAFKSQQQTQQMIAGLNVLRGIPPQLLNGKRLDITPIIQEVVDNVFGPRISPRILIDERDELSVPPDMENELMHNGLPAVVHPLDNDQEHMDAHMAMAQRSGDGNGLIRSHIAEHIQAIAKKTQAKAGPQGQQGTPGGAGPGTAGTPRPGAVPAMPRGGQAPPGTIQQDQLVDPSRMPRPQR